MIILMYSNAWSESFLKGLNCCLFVVVIDLLSFDQTGKGDFALAAVLYADELLLGLHTYIYGRIHQNNKDKVLYKGVVAVNFRVWKFLIVDISAIFSSQPLVLNRNVTMYVKRGAHHDVSMYPSTFC